MKKMQHDVDPRKKILGEVGDLSKVDVFYNEILLGIYERPEKTQSGIILTGIKGGIQEEDKWQGKVCLVLKIGPQAFKDDEDFKFNGQTLKEGDWICCRPSDGWFITINGKLCRMLVDRDIKMRIPDPDFVF